MEATDKAFPSKVDNSAFQGLQVRDYIAIQAMTGLSANSELNERSFEDIADMAYKQADAMIKRSEVNE